MGSGAEVAALLAMLGPLESKLSQLERSSLTRLRRIKKLGIAAFVSWLLSSWIMMSVLRAKREMRELSDGLAYHYAHKLPADSPRHYERVQTEFVYGVLHFFNFVVTVANLATGAVSFVVGDVLGWEGTLVAAATFWFVVLPFLIKTGSKAREQLRKSLAARKTTIAMRKAQRRASFLDPSTSAAYRKAAADQAALSARGDSFSSAASWTDRNYAASRSRGGAAGTRIRSGISVFEEDVFEEDADHEEDDGDNSADLLGSTPGTSPVEGSAGSSVVGGDGGEDYNGTFSATAAAGASVPSEEEQKDSWAAPESDIQEPMSEPGPA
mmetsp:Transcript_7565/g.18234  ORF Transcript_7565/g.18234 Transcript_7565/m.18234 type:complete len:325 (-) Transcript_7565:116-1090(-)|eukprot:CAMPEP_0178996800 /NCGR_PEP_ID=MMETSP0795-20121207/8573_1 /TAXON_ID=88552 /ORGANISM="Amoebophrya sp., Strain Ameob2" /LENGTH=324 /DNA_ID=CAMNT_0020689237 /DNA_START=78 /DNA_END=1052 /DNA_ORIENTATION=+